MRAFAGIKVSSIKYQSGVTAIETAAVDETETTAARHGNAGLMFLGNELLTCATRRHDTIRHWRRAEPGWQTGKTWPGAADPLARPGHGR
jgi:hypothetical protein